MRQSGSLTGSVLATVLFWGTVLPLAGAVCSPAWAERASVPSVTLSRPEWNRSLMARGRVSERLGQKEDALADYTLAIESHALAGDEQARALFDRGLLLDGMDRLDDAVNDYSAALSLSPKFTAALNNRANALRRGGHFPEAQRDYLASLAAGNPQSQYSYFGLAQIAEALGNKTDAEELYAQALAADPNYTLASERLMVLSSREDGPSPRSAAPSASSISAGSDSIAGASAESHPSAPIPRQVAQVQLGAWRSQAEASEGWDRAMRQAGETLRGLSPRIVAVDLPGAGRYYRLRVGTEQTRSRALCAALVTKGLDCIQAHN